MVVFDIGFCFLRFYSNIMNSGKLYSIGMFLEVDVKIGYKFEM